MKLFPTDAQERRGCPVFSGLLNYFPHACVAVAKWSMIANEQHNTGEEMHWAKEKSVGTGDQLVRHLMEAMQEDTEEAWCAMAWRALELLERRLESLPPFDQSCG